MIDLLNMLLRYRDAEATAIEDAFYPDGLTKAQRWARYLVCRSRSHRLVELEWSLTRDRSLTIRSYDWSDDTDTCLSPDAYPSQQRYSRHAVSRWGLIPALTSVANESSVLVLSGMENVKFNRCEKVALRNIIDRSRYAVLTNEVGTFLDESLRLRFKLFVQDMGVSASFCSMCDEDVICALGGHEALPLETNFTPAKVLALMNVYNEADIIEESVNALLAQGIDLYVIDDGSTDGTADILKRMSDSNRRIKLAKLSGSVRNHFDKPALLRQKLEYARYAFQAGYTWMLLADADEIRQSPWPELPLPEAFAHVEQMGYNAVDFTVLDFRFLEGEPRQNTLFESDLRHFEFGSRPGHFVQIKAWRHGAERCINAIPSGGHDARFAGRRVFPLKFLLKHYPLRSLMQAHRKIYKDRLPRFMPESVREGKDIQYDCYKDRAPLGWSREALHEWDEWFHSRYLTERLSGLGLPGNLWR